MPKRKNKNDACAGIAAIMIGQGCAALNEIDMSMKDKKDIAHEAVEQWFAHLEGKETQWGPA